MLLLLTAFLVFVYATLEALSESAQINLRSGVVANEKQLQRIWHASDAAKRCMVFTVCFWLLTNDVTETLFYSCFALAVYWLMFDIVLNNFRDKPAFYVGQTAAMDKGLRSMAESIHVAPEVLALLVKIALIGICFLLVVL